VFRSGPVARRNPGLKSETWATHSKFVRAILFFLINVRAGPFDLLNFVRAGHFDPLNYVRAGHLIFLIMVRAGHLIFLIMFVRAISIFLTPVGMTILKRPLGYHLFRPAAQERFDASSAVHPEEILARLLAFCS
jgi:hypothetical protein